jgi:hypothetical protein
VTCGIPSSDPSSTDSGSQPVGTDGSRNVKPFSP